MVGWMRLKFKNQELKPIFERFISEQMQELLWRLMRFDKSWFQSVR